MSYYLRFEKTSAESLVGYLLMLASELKQKSQQETLSSDEKMWYKDASALVHEVMLRYDELRLDKEFREHGTIRGRKIGHSDR